MDDPEGVILLMEAFADSHWPFRKKSASLLMERDPSIIPIMMDILEETSNQDINYWSVKVLENFGPEAMDALKELSAFPDREIRYFVATALSFIEHDGTIPILTDMLGDEDWVVRQEAAKGLEQRGDTAIQYLRVVFATGDQDVKYWIIKIMGRVLKEDAVRILEKAIKVDDPEMRYHTVIALGETDNEAAAPLLIAALSDSSWIVRRQAAESIEQLGEKAVKHLMKAFNSGDADLKYWVIRLYGRIMGGQGVRSLKKILESTNEKETQYYVISSLGEIKAIEAAQTLTDCLGDGNWTIRKHAADCLTGMGKFALKALDAASRKEQNNDFYFWCSKVLEGLGKRAIPLLLRILDHEDKTVRLQAAHALAGKEGKKVDQTLIRRLSDKLWPVRKEISEILIKRGESIVPTLLEEMSSGTDDIVFWGKKVIGTLGVKAARAVLTCLADQTTGKILLEKVERFHDPYLTGALAKYLATKAEGVMASRIFKLLERATGEGREVWDALDKEIRKAIVVKISGRKTQTQPVPRSKPDDRHKATTISIMDANVENPCGYLLDQDIASLLKLSPHKLVPLLGQALNLRYGIIHGLVSEYSLEAVVGVTKKWLSLTDEVQGKIKKKETWLKNHVRMANRETGS